MLARRWVTAVRLGCLPGVTNKWRIAGDPNRGLLEQNQLSVYFDLSALHFGGVRESIQN